MFQRNGIRYCGFHLPEERIQILNRQWKAAVSHFPAYPAGRFAGRGIVMCAGGTRYFTCAWISIRQLRSSGCHLPVEVWYAGNELSAAAIIELERYNVRCKNFLDYGVKGIGGFAKKPFAILKSSFREILYLDADNHCIGNAEQLFELDGYKKNGAVFWPDYWTTPMDNPIWRIMDLDYVAMKEQESGQLLIDKQKCWLPLNLSSYFNIENETYYKLLYGDKDTFRFAWMALKQEFHFIQQPPDPCGYTDLQGRFLGITMVQYDESGHPLFLHRNLLKWDVTRTNELVWQQIKRFNSAKYPMEYIIGYSETNHHMTIDLGGDCELIDPGHLIVQLEEACLKDLEVLRQSNFYHQMLIHTHVKESRRFPDEYGLIHV